MCLIYKCVICGKDIPNPNVECYTCGSMRCKRLHAAYRFSILDKYKSYWKIYYFKNKERLKRYHHLRYLRLKKMRRRNGLGK
jgi:hypothetical protein